MQQNRQVLARRLRPKPNRGAGCLRCGVPDLGTTVRPASTGVHRRRWRLLLTWLLGPPSGQPLILLPATLCHSRPSSLTPVAAASAGSKLSVRAVGNYIAKYATKSLDAPGLPQQPLRSSQDLAALRCHRHYRAMITTAWELGGGKLAPARTRLCKWAYTLGHGGHFLTKSRRYSVTFGQLRHARTQHRKQQHHPDGEHDPWGRPLDDTIVLTLADWHYQGTGYASTPAAELALASAARSRDHDRVGRAA